MSEKKLVKTKINTPTKGLSSLELIILYRLVELSKEMLKPRPISWASVYVLGGVFYLTRGEVRKVIKSLSDKGFVRIQRNGVVVLKKFPLLEIPKVNEGRGKLEGGEGNGNNIY